MINPNALPTSPTVQDFQNLESALDSPDYNNTLQAMRYMQAQRQPTTGINMLPQVTVPMQEGGMMEEAMMEQQMPLEPMNPEEQAMMMQQVEQQEPREPNPEIQAMAQQVASFGRGGDKLLLHIRPDEMQGLSSMLTVTINPTTGMPEVFLNKIARAGKRIVKGATKGVKKVASSKVFKTIAPIALAIAAPYALGALAPSVFGAGATFASGALGAGTALGAATTAGIGSLLGGLASGQKFGDAAKGALLSGATAGLIQGGSNVVGGKGFQSGIKKFDGPVGLKSGAEQVAATRAAGANPNVNIASGGKTTFKELPTTLQQNAVNLGNAPANVASTTGAKPLIQLEGAGERFLNIAKDDLVRDNLLKTGTRVGGKILAADLATTPPEEFLPEAVEEDGTTQTATPRIYDPEKEGFKQVAETTMGDYGAFGGGLTEEDILRMRTTGGMGNILGRTFFRNAAEGGLVQLAKGGEFSGPVPGEGGGMDDNVYMPIKEGREQVGTLAVSPTEYVVDSYTMAALGDGNPNEGAKVMDRTIKQIRKKAYGTTKQPNEIDGLAALRPMVQGV